MTRRRIRAGSSKSAKRKGTSKARVVTKVKYIKGTKKGKKKTYAVTTRKRIKHTSRGWSKDRKEYNRRQAWERRHRKKK